MKIAIILLLACTMTACADQGPPLPRPAQEVEKAIALSRAALVQHATSAEGTNFYSGFITWRISYQTADLFWQEHKDLLGKKSPFPAADRDWTWFITYTHPEGDVLFVYRVLRSGEVVELVPVRKK